MLTQIQSSGNNESSAGENRVSTTSNPCSADEDSFSKEVVQLVSALDRDGSTRKAKTRSRASGNPILEEEAYRLATLKRRRAMELQQTLAFELRTLAREVSNAIYSCLALAPFLFRPPGIIFALTRCWLASHSFASVIRSQSFWGMGAKFERRCNFYGMRLRTRRRHPPGDMYSMLDLRLVTTLRDFPLSGILACCGTASSCHICTISNDGEKERTGEE